MTDCAVIQFPGSNCEYETLRALQDVGLEVDLVPWNTTIDSLGHHKSYVLPGGFSFQDRVRAGVVASVLPIMELIAHEASSGKPVLGICNGCQMLAEMGLVFEGDDNDMAMAPNMKGEYLHGFVCDWVYVRIENPASSLFTSCFSPDDVIPIPINHGEGKFVFHNHERMQTYSGMTIKYCNEQGDLLSDYPVNPNGSALNIAGIANEKGNVLAMMPHPERAVLDSQVPVSLHHEDARKRRQGCLTQGPWKPFFKSLAEHLNV